MLIQIKPTPRIDPVDAELKALQQRKARLLQLITLRDEVCTMEKDLLCGDGDRGRVKIILEETARAFGVRFESLFSKGRSNDVCTPRFAAFHLIRKHTNMTLCAMGKIFDKDHGTVISGIRVAKARMQTEPNFKRAVETIEQNSMARFEME